MANKKDLNFKAIATLILFFIGGSAFYALINQSVEDLLLIIGITNVYLQFTITIILVVLLLIILGVSFNKAFKKMVF